MGGEAGNGGSDVATAGCPGLAPIVGPTNRLYVATDGDDGASGDQDAPLATLEEAANRFPNGGTVIVRGGIYPHQSWFHAAGEEGNPLHIRAADGETPIFDGSGVQSEWSAVVSLASASHVVFEGFEVRNCSAPNCRGISSDAPVLDLTIRDCHIHHIDGPAARFAGRQIRIEGNEFHDIALTNENNTDYPGGGWPTCTGTTPDRSNPPDPWADDVVIRGNRIRDCWGEGIGLWYASNAVVEDNSIENAWNVGIYADNAFNLRIARNYVHMLRGNNGGAGTGILFGTEDYSAWGIPNVRTHDVEVVNNVVVAGGGIGWWAMSTPESTYATLRLLHNTVVGTHRGALNFGDVDVAVDDPIDSLVMNNVFLEESESWIGDPDAFSLAGNAWLNNSLPSIAGASDVSLDVTVGTLAKGTDAQPLASSVGTGETGTGVQDDFLCSPRDTTAPTRGAFAPRL
jgi:parallel beta-helix repeat protein